MSLENYTGKLIQTAGFLKGLVEIGTFVTDEIQRTEKQRKLVDEAKTVQIVNLEYENSKLRNNLLAEKERVCLSGDKKKCKTILVN